MHLTFASLLFALPFALAEPKFVAPTAGSKLSAGTISVSWEDGGNAPSISDMSSYQLLLYTGSNDKPFQLADLKAGSFSGDNSISTTIPSGVGVSSVENAYFLGMVATSSIGSITVFSDRFTLSGMTGSFPAGIESDLASISGSSGPQAKNVRIDERQAAAAADDASFDIPFNSQTGLTRYASMQKLPGTTITATNTAPLFPSTSVPLATTFLSDPTVMTTVTQEQTATAASHPNSAAPASHPTDAMQKFLNRWKD